MNVLGMSCAQCKQLLRRRLVWCILLILLTVSANILFTALRTEQNHTWMLLLNIAADVLCSFFLLYYADMQILPQYRLYKLFCRPQEQLTGTVTWISPAPQRYMDLDCYCIMVDNRRVFLPVCGIVLEESSYTFHLVSNIILEVRQ